MCLPKFRHMYTDLLCQNVSLTQYRLQAFYANQNQTVVLIFSVRQLSEKANVH